jgi:hypothetical protein
MDGWMKCVDCCWSFVVVDCCCGYLHGEVGDHDARLPLPLQLDDDGAHLLVGWFIYLFVCLSVPWCPVYM